MLILQIMLQLVVVLFDITGGTITITPQFSTSKIFVLIDCAVYVSTSGITYGYCGSKIIRGSSTEVSALNMTDETDLTLMVLVQLVSVSSMLDINIPQ